MRWFLMSINNTTGYMLIDGDGIFVNYYSMEGKIIEAETTVTTLENLDTPPSWYIA